MSSKRTLIPAVIAAVTIAAGAQAQTTPVSPNTGVTVPNTGVTAPNSVFTPGFTPGTGFFDANTGLFVPNGTVTVDPRFVDPRVNFFDPRLQFNGSSLGFTPGVTPGNQFVPGFGGGYYNPYYGPLGYSGPTFNSIGPWSSMNARGFQRNVGLPVAGVNSPPVQRTRYRVTRIIDGGSGSGYDYESLRRADELSRTGNPAAAVGARSQSSEFGGATQGVTTGTTEVDPDAAQVSNAPGIIERYGPNGITGPYIPQAPQVARSTTRRSTTTARATTQVIPGVVSVSSIEPQQIRLVNRMENVMEDRPLTEGTVLGIDDDGVLVRFERDGEILSRHFPRAEVFFFDGTGRLATASTGGFATGTSVLIPLPATSRVESQAVAGSRQEYSTPRTRVKGSRSIYRNRRPAK